MMEFDGSMDLVSQSCDSILKLKFQDFGVSLSLSLSMFLCPAHTM